MIETIEKIIKMFETADISKLDLEVDNIKIKLEKNQNKEVSFVNLDSKNIDKECINENNVVIKSPVVGTFYNYRGKESKKLVSVGQEVKKGDVLCIIEAMKVMNEVVSSCDGVVLDIKASNDELVQFDQVLMTIGKSV